MGRTPSSKKILPLLLVISGLALTGCGSSSKVAAPAQISQSQAGDAAVQAAALILAGGSPSPVPASLMEQGPSGFSSMRGAGPNGAAAETTIVGDGFTWSFAIQWFNAQAQEQVEYNPLTTVRMQAHSRGNGTFSAPNAVVSIGTSGYLDVSGISSLQDTLITNATQNDTLSYEVSGENGSASFVSHCAGGFSQVVELKPASSGHPLSGSAQWAMDVTKHIEGPNGTVDEHFVASVVVTFNGTNLVPVVVNGTYPFILNLDTGVVTPVAV